MLRMETTKCGGAGGQNVNKVETKVFFYKPTSLVVMCKQNVAS
jgi:protein subunit release factor B